MNGTLEISDEMPHLVDCEQWLTATCFVHEKRIEQWLKGSLCQYVCLASANVPTFASHCTQPISVTQPPTSCLSTCHSLSKASICSPLLLQGRDLPRPLSRADAKAKYSVVCCILVIFCVQ